MKVDLANKLDELPIGLSDRIMSVRMPVSKERVGKNRGVGNMN